VGFSGEGMVGVGRRERVRDPCDTRRSAGAAMGGCGGEAEQTEGGKGERGSGEEDKGEDIKEKEEG